MNEENQTIIKALDMFGRVPEQYELLNEIDRLNNIINELEKYIKENSWYYNTSDGCQWVNQFKVLDKLKELKESGNNE